MSNYTTVSIPKRLAIDIKEFIDDIGYWPSLGSFVRDACHKKLYEEKRKILVQLALSELKKEEADSQ